MKKSTIIGMTATALVMGMSLSPGVAFASTGPFSGGTGTAKDPYQIASQQDLETLMNTPKYWSDDFVVTSDITASYSGPAGYDTPIGTQQQPFTGTFNGDGHTLSDFVINNSSDHSYADGAGLFGWTNGATIENLVVNREIVSGGTDVGRLVGVAGPKTTLSGITVQGLTGASGNENVGGLVGLNEGNISNSQVANVSMYFSTKGPQATLTDNSFGGLVGRNEVTGTITNSTSAAELNSAPLPLVGIENVQLPTVTAGTSYKQQFSLAGNPTGSFSWMVAKASSLPAGLNLDTTGALTGAPTTPGNYQFSVNAGEMTPSVMTVENVSLAVGLGTPMGLTHSMVNSSGWTESWSKVPGATGYNLYIGGTKVNGQPIQGTSYQVSGEKPGTAYAVTVKALAPQLESSASQTDSVTTLSALSTNASASLPSVLQGTPYSQSVAVTGGQGPYTYTLASGALPKGLSLSDKGMIQGTPTVTGTASFAVKATDAAGDVLTNTYTLYVIPAAPVGSLTNLLTSAVVGNGGQTLSSNSGGTKITLVIAPGTFAQQLQMSLSTGQVPQGLLQSSSQLVAAFGVNFNSGQTPQHPLTFTLLNTNITSSSKVYKIVNGKLVAVSATVTNGKAVITFTNDPTFVIVQSKANPKTVPGATTPETGIPVLPWTLGGSLTVFVGGALIWLTRRRKHTVK